MQAWVEQQLGCAVVAQTPQHGGCIHQAWRLELADGRSVFAKTNAASVLPMFEAELDSLQQLARHAPAALVIPKPLAWGVAGDRAVLLLSWLQLAGSTGAAGANGWFQCGQGLAQLHRSSAGSAPVQGYGAAADNFIGSAPQLNGWRSDWGLFFAECRLAPQLAWAASRGVPLRSARELQELVPRWLSEHHCEPVLVHGDLWCGNAGLLSNGRSTIFDPASFWGDREVDLAMAQLFGGFPKAFFSGYEDVWPLEPGAKGRVALYNLYHLLNHANLLGGSWVRQAQASIDQLLFKAAD